MYNFYRALLHFDELSEVFNFANGEYDERRKPQDLRQKQKNYRSNTTTYLHNHCNTRIYWMGSGCNAWVRRRRSKNFLPRLFHLPDNG